MRGTPPDRSDLIPLPPVKMQSHRGGLIFLLALLGFVVIPCAPAAWIMGQMDLLKMDDGVMDASGRRMTNLGRFIGMALTIYFLVFVAAMCLVRFLV
jgi:hypothetical protein